MKVSSIHSEKLISWMFRIIVYGLKTIGLAPISLHIKPLPGNSRNTFINVFLHSKLGLYYNLILSILVLIIGAFQIRIQIFRLIHSPGTYIHRTLDLMQYVLILFTAWFEILYWAFRQKKAAYIMNRLLDVHCLLSASKEKFSNERMLIFLAMHMTFSVFLWITFTVSGRILTDSLFVTIAFALPMLVNYCLLLEYSMILGYVARELETLNTNFLTLKEFTNDSFLTFLPICDLSVLGSPIQNQLANIKLIHSIHTTLYEVSQDVADFFSLPTLPLVLLFFCASIYNVYFLIAPAVVPDRTNSAEKNIVLAMWLIIGFYPIILLCFYVTKTTKEAQLTGQLIHKLLATTKRREIITELERFSHHLIHEKVSFTAYGFFTLDFELLQSILGATGTYLVIIIQFVLQSVNT